MKRWKEIQALTHNPFLNLYHIAARTKNGDDFSYYFASRNSMEGLKGVTGQREPEGIAVYALWRDDPGQIVMIRQFRYPINDYLYELPAGLIDPGETPQQSAVREMKEETGLELSIYGGGDACFRAPFFMAQGLTDESGVMVYGYASGNISKRGQEDSEDIEVLFVDKRRARELLREGRLSMRAAFHLMHFIHASEERPFAFLD